jgi:hypothetical protein
MEEAQCPRHRCTFWGRYSKCDIIMHMRVCLAMQSIAQACSIQVLLCESVTTLQAVMLLGRARMQCAITWRPQHLPTPVIQTNITKSMAAEPDISTLLI